MTAAFYFILKALHTANLIPSTVSVATSFLAVYLTFRRSPYYALAYAANETRCRSAVLEGYFGEGAPAACGVCDICLAHKRAGKRQAQGGTAPSSDGGLREKLLQRLSRGAADPHELAAEFPGEAQQIGRALRELLDEGIAGTGRDGKIGLK